MKARLYKYMYITIAAAFMCLGCLVALKNPHNNNMKISEVLFENFQSLVVKFSIYLNRCVFVMSSVAYLSCTTNNYSCASSITRLILYFVTFIFASKIIY